MAATIIDVAKKCGYSKATVSRAFASPETVSERAKKRIYAAASELNYTPNPIARAMARQKTDNISFVVHENQYPAILNPFYSLVLEAIMQEAMKRDYSLFVTSNDHMRLPTGDAYIKKHMDGVIIAGQTDEAYVTSFLSQNIPVVVLNNLIEMEGLPCITVDNYHGAKEAAAYLVGRGHRRIGLLAGRLSPRIYGERYQGYLDALADAGIAPDASIVRDLDANEKQAEACTKELLKMENRPTALLCTNDTIAVGAVKAVLRSGLRVPEDISIIGIDGSSARKYMDPLLTSVGLFPEKQGAKCADILLDMLEGKKVKYVSGSPVQLVKGASVRKIR